MSADRIEVELPDGSIIDAPVGTTKAQIQAKLDGKGALPASSGQGVTKESFREVGRVADQAVRKGATSFFGLIGDSALAGMRNLSSRPTGIFGPPKKESFIHDTKWGDAQKTLETGGGLLPDVSVPKTETGKGVANVLEAVVGAASGGGWANLGQRAAIGLGSGVGGEAAARATDNNPIARVLGSLLGGGGTAAVQAWRPNLTELVQDATGSLRGTDWKKAKILQSMAKDEGTPSIASQFLGPRSTLDDVVMQASANPAVRPKLTSHLETAPKKVKALTETKVIENLSPATGERNSALDDVQRAAEGAITRIREKAGNAYTGAVPTGLENSRFTPPEVAAMRDEMLRLARASGTGPTSERGKDLIKFATEKLVDPATGRLITSKGHINSLYKDVNQLGVDQGYSGLGASDIRKVLKNYTSEFQPARDAYRKVLDQDLKSVEKSLIGQIAQQGGGTDISKVTAKKGSIDLMFNDGAKPMEIKQFADQVGPEAVSDMLREHIAKTMIKVWPDNTVPLNQAIKAPSTLQGKLFGDDWQVKNFDAALAATAKSQGLQPQPLIKGAKHFFTLLNSYKDVKLAVGVSPAQTAQVAGTNFPGALAEPFGTTRRFFGSQATTKTYEKLAEMVMSPRGLEQLEALGRAPKPERVKALVLSMMTAVNDQAEQKGIDNEK